MSDEDENAEKKPCLLCGADAPHSGFDPTVIECSVCGNYKAGELFIRLTYPDVYGLAALSPITREYWERNLRPLLITEKNLEDLKKRLPRENDVSDKTQRLLQAIERQTTFPGESISLELKKDYPLAYARNSNEFVYYLQHLTDRGWITWDNTPLDSESATITPDGWAALDSFKKRNIESEKVFVAMWFKDEMKPVYSDGIALAIEGDCGYKSIRVDDEEFLGNVVDEILAEIRESRFVVADVTGQRAGVYYEAGYALGLELPVIWTCREDEIHKVHFDTRQENHIVWKDATDLRERLANRIRAVIGLSPSKREA